MTTTTTTTSMTTAYLGIDVGTQGLSSMLIDATNPSNVIAVGEGSYDMTTSLFDQQTHGYYEQCPKDWLLALKNSLQQLRDKYGIILIGSSNNNNNVVEETKIETETTESATKKLKVSNDDTPTTSTAATIPVRYIQLLAIGVAGQMHGEVLLDSHGQVLGNTCRLWCDARNQTEATHLQSLFSSSTTEDENDDGGGGVVKVPKRMTIARFLWTSKHRPELYQQCQSLTTPAGYVVYKLTTNTTITTTTTIKEQQASAASRPKIHHTIGIGEGSGMFPISEQTKTWRTDLIMKYDHDQQSGGSSLSDILPTVLVAGQMAGRTPPLPKSGDEDHHDNSGDDDGDNDWFLDGLLPRGIPVAPAEGDHPASLVASLMSRRGQISCSFGTSVVANVIGGSGDSIDVDDDGDKQPPKPKKIVQTNPSVDHFMTVTGQPTYMVWLRNGTTWLNHLVQTQYGNDWTSLMPKLLNAPDDCHGLISLPFLDDEPGLNVHNGGTAMIIGHRGGAGGAGGAAAASGDDDDASDPTASDSNKLVGSTLKAALLATMFNLKLGTAPLLEQLADDPVDTKSTTSPSSPSSSSSTGGVVVTGGLAKTPATGQILANVFDTTVSVPEGAVGEEGCSWGAALLAMFMHQQLQQSRRDDTTATETQPRPTNSTFAEFLDTIKTRGPKGYVYDPQPTSVQTLDGVLARYKTLLALQPSLQQVVQNNTGTSSNEETKQKS